MVCMQTKVQALRSKFGCRYLTDVSLKIFDMTNNYLITLLITTLLSKIVKVVFETGSLIDGNICWINKQIVCSSTIARQGEQ